MNDLIVVGYPDEQRAYDVWAELVKLRHDYLVDLEDAAIIWRDENGKVHVTTPAHRAVAKGTVSGLFWGTLIGLLFMFPLAPLAGVAGGIMGGAGRRLAPRHQRRLQAARPGPGAAGNVGPHGDRAQDHPGEVHRGAAALRRNRAQDLAAPRRRA
jgi:hypothetical protein